MANNEEGDDECKQAEADIVGVVLDPLVLAPGEVAQDDEAGGPGDAAEDVPG